MNIETMCIHGAKDTANTSGAIGVPIYQSATFTHPGVGQSTGYDYSRVQNPTRESLEQLVAKLENGVDALAFSSGMAAVASLMELFAYGDHIIATEDLYGGSIRLFDTISQKNGLVVEYVDTGNIESIKRAITARTRAIFIETPTNPMMHVTDIAAVKQAIGGKNILLIVDNTFLTPYFQKPLELGADVVVHSGTKYLGGHNDTLAGFLVARTTELAEKLRFIYKTIGACLAPFDSFLMIRGIKTLAIRMDKSQKNALAIAQWLAAQEKIKKVYYTGLPDHPGFVVSKKQASGFGAMIAIEVDSEHTARQILERVKVLLYAESLGGVETLITYPMLQTHADVPVEKREARGINGKLLRISVGIENVDDLIDDLRQAMQ